MAIRIEEGMEKSMFVGRKSELQSLQEMYDKDGFSMTILYGRRRIGKSTLITEFLRGKKSVFYTATKVGAQQNAALFGALLLTELAPELTGVSITSLEAALDFLTGQLGRERIVMVIDELPYWADGDPALLSILQKYIDTKWMETNLKIILCGSSLSFMENEVLSEKSPLFGRREFQMKLEAFSYREAAEFVPNYSLEEKAICYGVTGGVAKYLSLFDPKQSLDDNIKRLFFHNDGYLFEETHNLLTQEFRDVTLMNNVIEQLASGANTVNEISQNVRESTQTVVYSLDKLIGIGLARKKLCMTEEKNKRKTQYVLKDHMFQFWYAFIPKAVSVIEMRQGDLYYDKVVKKQLHSYMGSVFEEMCREYTLYYGIRGAYDGFMTGVGTWWGVEEVNGEDGKKCRQSADIDVVAISDVDKTAVIGECKFKNEKIDKGVYETLIRRGSVLGGKYRIAKYLFFSLGGYTDWVIENKREDVLLLGLEDLYAAVSEDC